jgi:hypothetical protein
MQISAGREEILNRTRALSEFLSDAARPISWRSVNVGLLVQHDSEARSSEQGVQDPLLVVRFLNVGTHRLSGKSWLMPIFNDGQVLPAIFRSHRSRRPMSLAPPINSLWEKRDRR